MIAELKHVAIAVAIAGAIGTGVGLGLGWHMYHSKPIVQTIAEAKRQADGSLELSRIPTSNDSLPPKQIIPKGDKVLREIEVKVQPSSAGTGQTNGSGPREDAKSDPPVTLDLTLVKEPDNQERVIASSPDGEVISGIDIPLPDAYGPTVKVTPWAAGVGYTVDWMNGRRDWKGAVARDLGPFRVEAIVGKNDLTGVLSVRF